MPHVELPQAEFKVVMLGDTNTGKTSLVLRFVEGHFRLSQQPRSSTIGAFYITKRLSVMNVTCKIQIWDTAGQARFRKLGKMYYQNAAAVVICYNVNNPASLDVMKGWLEEVQRNVSAGSIVICICATKCDETHTNTSSTDSVNNSQVKEWAYAMGAMFMETSAKTNTNVTMLFRKITERVLEYQHKKRTIPVTTGAKVVEGGKVVKDTMIPLPSVSAQQQLQLQIAPPPSMSESTTSTTIIVNSNNNTTTGSTFAGTANNNTTNKLRRDKRTKEQDLEPPPSSNMCEPQMIMCGIFPIHQTISACILS